METKLEADIIDLFLEYEVMFLFLEKIYNKKISHFEYVMSVLR